MQPWNCCRTCTSVHSLHPIFLLPAHSEKYSNAVFLTTGVKVTINDSLPQEMCSTCILFINESIRFRKNCEEVQKQFQDNILHGIKLENSSTLKTEENSTSIDILDEFDEDFKDFDDNLIIDTLHINDTILKDDEKVMDDNITLDTLQFNNTILKDDEKVTDDNITLDTLQFKDTISKDDEKVTEETNEATHMDLLIEIDRKPIDIVFNSKKRKARTIKVKRKECKDKGTGRVREEIECEYCHKILTSKLSLRNHYKIHTGFDVVCEHCGKKFITRRLLLMHCRAKHGYEKTDKCSFCDYKASNAEQVKIHERLHTGEKPFVCKECNAGFHRKSSYLQHVAIHLPEKTVQCDQCPARFKSVTLMRIHKNRHRPSQYTFKCGVCDNNFARRRNVARHLQRVHGLPPDHQIQKIKIH